MREKVRVNGPIWVSWLLALVVLAAWYSPGRVADPLTLACLFAAQFYLSTHSTDIGGSIQHTYETLLSLAAAAVYGPETGVVVLATANLIFRIRASRSLLNMAPTLLSAGIMYPLVRYVCTLPVSNSALDWLRMAAVVSLAEAFDGILLWGVISLRTGQAGEVWRHLAATMPRNLVIYAIAFPLLVWTMREHGLIGMGAFLALIVMIMFALRAVMEVEHERARRGQAEEARFLDGLTGVYNRAWVQERGATLIATKGDWTLLLLDIDFFKHLNDEHGHLCGDEVLRQVARSMEAALRPSGGVVVRYGGEEFAALVPGRLPVGHDLLVRLAEPRTVDYDGCRVRVTMSAGVAYLPEDGTSLEQLIRVADRGLYQAKAAGRNRVAYGSCA